MSERSDKMNSIYLTEAEALELGQKLCDKLGSSWKPRVWHNLYWCYCAKNGPVHVHENQYKEVDPVSYSAYYMPSSIVVGYSTESPVLAVENLKRKYTKACEEMLSHYNALSNVGTGQEQEYTFWFTSARINDKRIEEKVVLPWGLTDDEVKNALEAWCEKVYPGFNCEDHVARNYGWK